MPEAPTGRSVGDESGDTRSDSAELSPEALFDVVGDTRRRYVVHCLKQRDEPMTVRDLAEQVAAWENGKAIEELTSKERKRVYVSLYQSHLSTLDDDGIVEYDADRGTVELSSAASDTDVYMEVVRSEDIPWNWYYLGLTGACALVLGLVWFDVEPFVLVPDLGWAAVVLVLFGGSALVHSVTSNRMRFGDDGPPPELRDGGP